MRKCLSCSESLAENDKFCKQCGQKTTTLRLNLWSIISDFFSNLFNIETKIWRTFRDIWIPCKLTKAFIQGKRMQYYNPLRIFLMVLFAFFTVFLANIKGDINKLNQINMEQEKRMWTENLVVQFDSIAMLSTTPIDTLEKFKKALFGRKKKAWDIDTKLTEEDSISLAERILEDTKIKNDTVTDNRGEFSFEDNDLFTLSGEELLKKYSDGNEWKDWAMLQIQKILKNLSSSIKFFIGNGTWAIIAVILSIAAFFKLLYIRHDYHYVEHFIFHLYGHTRILLLALLAMLSTYLGFKNSWFMPLLSVGLIYLYWSMLSYYKQSKTKTFVKFLMMIFAYTILLTFCSVMILGISFAVL